MKYYLIIDRIDKDAKKISLARFIRDNREIDYSEAKRDVDKILEGRPVVYSFPSIKELTFFKEAVEEYGAFVNNHVGREEPVVVKKSTPQSKATALKK